MDLRTLSVVCFCMVGVSLAQDVCQELFNGVEGPLFGPQEFTVDVEMSRKELGKVAQVRLIYSASRQIIRMLTLENGVKRDLFFLASENQEVLRFDYSQGRGTCTVSTFQEEEGKAMFFVGGDRKGKLQYPLGFLRMTGLSGFENRHILLNALPDTTIRDIPVKGWKSCQKLAAGGSNIVLEIKHYFDYNNIPVAIMVNGRGNVKGTSYQNFNHVYSFFNFQPRVDPVELETPEGVYCKRRTPADFPPLPSRISFSSEVYDRLSGAFTTQDEIFDTVKNFALMREGGLTTFREYNSGLSFKIQDNIQTCTIKNISDDSGLPFDYNVGGIVKEITMDQFFYLGHERYQQYEYIGQRTVRGIPADVYVGTALLRPDLTTTATVEWYFAQNNIQSWNDKIPEYTAKKLRMPLMFRAWRSEEAQYSTDINLFNVDFAPIMVGAIDLSPCMEQTSANHFQLLVKGKRDDVLNMNQEGFKQNALDTIATACSLQWWRIANFQLYFNDNDVVIEFEILGKPPLASDASPPPIYVSVQEAFRNLQQAVDNGLTLKGFDPATKTFSKTFTAVLGVIKV